MSFLTIHKSSSGLYVLGGTSVRLPEGPRNSKQSLGKLNLSSKKFIINDNYNIWSLKNDFTDDKVYDWLDKNGFKDFKIQLKTDKTDDNYINEKNNHNFIDNTIKIDKIDENIFSIRDCISATDKNIGLSHFLNFISESIGLTEILKVTFPDKWYQILVLAHFKVASQYPDLYCNFFIENNDYNISFKQLKSQRISDLYKKITFNEVTNFYYRWSNYIKEKEYLACDITSISTYSENLSYGALGYNRDGDKLKQINICLLFGETSGLPVFATKYHGSLNDVRTFVSTASQFNLLRNNNFKLIMDKGFYSKQNINYMLSRDHKIPFLISVPLTVDYLKKIVDENHDLEHDTSHLIHKGDHNILYRTIRISWDNKNKLYGHLFLDIENKYNEHSEILTCTDEMYKLACENPDKYRYDLKFMKRLSFRKSFKSPTGYIVKIRPNILSKYTYNCYFLLLTNEIKDPTVALNIYRNRNAVEEAFNRLKNSLELKRMRVHSDIASQSKLFIEFLSLIIISKIHYVMERENLYKDYTMFELLKEINKQHVLEINNFRIVSPAHYRQKLIFNKFNCPLISEIFLGPEPVLNVV